MLRLRRFLTRAPALDDARFRGLLRNTSLVGGVLVLLSELAPLLSPRFPQDVLGSGVMLAGLVSVGIAAHLRAPRPVVAGAAYILFGILGWYISRVLGLTGGVLSLHRDAIYAVLAAAHALLLFSAFEFTVSTLVFVTSLIASAVWLRGAAVADYTLTLFYAGSFHALAMVGIVTRTRLQRSEKSARAELERLNDTLHTEVGDQVDRIRRAEALGRFLPPQVAEQVLAGSRDLDLRHHRRQVTVLCASPFGFLESLSAIAPDRVAPLVNAFVSEMARVAFERGGVIERFVGPRITVLFGAVDELAPSASALRAVDMAKDMQEASSALVRTWEAEGFSTIRLRMAIGICSGASIVGAFGSDRRVEYTALGAATARAYQLAAAAIPGEVRFDEASAQLLGGRLMVAEAESVEFSPGIPEPTYLFEGDPPAGGDQAPVDDDGDRSETGRPTATWSALASTMAPSESSAPRGDVSELAPGSLFDGRYRIRERVGKGGMAVVYRAEHVSLGQTRALKLLHPGRLRAPGAVDQFRREAEATARMRHPNAVELHDFGRSVEGHYYLVLDYVEGEPLSAMLRRERELPPRLAIRLAVEILAALEAAHELRLVHRDLKPSNVLIDSSQRVRVTDFGLAQPHGDLDDVYGRWITGTPGYMSPEQCRGRPVDARSDLFSFGVTLYQMVTGRLPHRGEHDRDQLVQATVAGDLARLGERGSNLPAELREAVDRCLCLEPLDRPRSAAALRRALETVEVGVRSTAPSIG